MRWSTAFQSKNEEALNSGTKERGFEVTRYFAFIVVLLLVVPSHILGASTAASQNHSRADSSRSIASESGNSSGESTTTPDRSQSDPQQLLQAYETAMIGISQQYSARLVDIAESVKRGEISSDEGKRKSAELYQLALMQFQLFQAWREMQEHNMAQDTAPSDLAAPDEKQIVVISLALSSVRINPSLSQYLSLSDSQVAAINELTAREQAELHPLLLELKATRARLSVLNADHAGELSVKRLAAKQADTMAKLIVANAHIQTRVYGLLNNEQQKKFDELKAGSTIGRAAAR